MVEKIVEEIKETNEWKALRGKRTEKVDEDILLIKAILLLNKRIPRDNFAYVFLWDGYYIVRNVRGRKYWIKKE